MTYIANFQQFHFSIRVFNKHSKPGRQITTISPVVALPTARDAVYFPPRAPSSGSGGICEPARVSSANLIEDEGGGSSWFYSVMFCFARKPVIDNTLKELILRNEMIEQEIERERMASKKIMKILLLGGPESGKSTIFKQMKILHMNGFTDLDMINYRYLIYSNIVTSVAQIIDSADQLNISIPDELRAPVDKFKDYHNQTHPAEIELAPITDVLKKISESKFTKQILAQHHEIILLDSAKYVSEAICGEYASFLEASWDGTDCVIPLMNVTYSCPNDTYTLGSYADGHYCHFMVEKWTPAVEYRSRNARI
uniref:G-protein alpha subunit n=1 Tax=Panagrellus redivivus TaxID=6233 RepID=A0A7E4V9V1_PANRE